jgi:hypothetical protein
MLFAFLRYDCRVISSKLFKCLEEWRLEVDGRTWTIMPISGSLGNRTRRRDRELIIRLEVDIEQNRNVLGRFIHTDASFTPEIVDEPDAEALLMREIESCIANLKRTVETLVQSQ